MPGVAFSMYGSLFDSIPGPILVILVALMWGSTNPLLKRTSSPAGLTQSLKSALFFTSFVCNQLGSALYVLALRRMPLALAQPLCNGLAFAVTAVSDPIFFGSVCVSTAPPDLATQASTVRKANSPREDTFYEVSPMRLGLAASFVTLGITLYLSAH